MQKLKRKIRDRGSNLFLLATIIYGTVVMLSQIAVHSTAEGLRKLTRRK